MRNDPASLSTGILAEALPDHRLFYLDYEGPVTGGRGTVIQWDSGIFEWRLNQMAICEVDVTGRLWRGIVRLEQVHETSWTVSQIAPSHP